MEGDFAAEYREYLERFESTLGPQEVGAYATHRGRLIKKLRYEEFLPRWKEYREAEELYRSILERGDTINNVLVKVLRERCDEFLLERIA